MVTNVGFGGIRYLGRKENPRMVAEELSKTNDSVGYFVELDKTKKNIFMKDAVVTDDSDGNDLTAALEREKNGELDEVVVITRHKPKS
ncbi:MAG: hypothetical protein A2Y25_10955 [Candidatus Melainabacteria bacterium GWF2_37_15]|nr:MAG: hypothetical protein A2Y25_10955 [Candidatus Melainabacteria bacterium GWF2_37_15]